MAIASGPPSYEVSVSFCLQVQLAFVVQYRGEEGTGCRGGFVSEDTSAAERAPLNEVNGELQGAWGQQFPLG